MIRINELKTHKEVVMIQLKQVSEMIENVFKEAEKIAKQNYSDFCKDHSDILSLLHKHMIRDKEGIEQESYYEFLKRILKKHS